jgi:hypothetical protein
LNPEDISPLTDIDVDITEPEVLVIITEYKTYFSYHYIKETTNEYTDPTRWPHSS